MFCRERLDYELSSPFADLCTRVYRPQVFERLSGACIRPDLFGYCPISQPIGRGDRRDSCPDQSPFGRVA